MKPVLFLLLAVLIRYTSFSLPADLNNNRDVLRKNAVLKQKTAKYIYSNDSAFVFSNKVDSTVYDEKARVLNYVEYFSYGTIRVNQNYRYTDYDSLEVIFKVSETQDPLPIFEYAYTYLFENKRLIEKKKVFLDNSIFEKFAFQYNNDNKIKDIDVFDEVGIKKGYIQFEYPVKNNVVKLTKTAEKEILLTEEFHYDDSGKMNYYSCLDESTKAFTKKTYTYDSYGRVSAIEISNSENADDKGSTIIQKFSYLENGLIKEVTTYPKLTKEISGKTNTNLPLEKIIFEYDID